MGEWKGLGELLGLLGRGVAEGEPLALLLRVTLVLLALLALFYRLLPTRLKDLALLGLLYGWAAWGVWWGWSLGMRWEFLAGAGLGALLLILEKLGRFGVLIATFLLISSWGACLGILKGALWPFVLALGLLWLWAISAALRPKGVFLAITVTIPFFFTAFLSREGMETLGILALALLIGAVAGRMVEVLSQTAMGDSLKIPAYGCLSSLLIAGALQIDLPDPKPLSALTAALSLTPTALFSVIIAFGLIPFLLVPCTLALAPFWRASQRERELRRFQAPYCLKHLRRPRKQRFRLFYFDLRCRSGRSDCLWEEVEEVVGRIGGPTAELGVHGRRLVVALWDPNTQRAQGADLDRLELWREAGWREEDSDRALDAVLQALLQDPTRPRDWLKGVEVVLVGKPPLSERAWRVLRSEFGAVREEPVPEAAVEGKT